MEAKTDPSMRRQCELLGVNRSSLYYEPVEPDAEELALMRRVDELHLKYPFYGSRKLTQALKTEGHDINRKRVQRLMRVMGLESTAPKPNTSKPSPEHAKYPYLLRNLKVSRVNQAWAADITYIPMAHGFIYLVAIIDWCSRRVLAWRVSNSLEPNFCVEALEEALAHYGCPEIFNTDQGSQFTSEDFIDVLLAHGIQISMDGKGRWLDNVFIERLFSIGKQVVIHASDPLAPVPEAHRHARAQDRRHRHRLRGSKEPPRVQVELFSYVHHRGLAQFAQFHLRCHQPTSTKSRSFAARQEE